MLSAFLITMVLISTSEGDAQARHDLLKSMRADREGLIAAGIKSDALLDYAPHFLVSLGQIQLQHDLDFLNIVLHPDDFKTAKDIPTLMVDTSVVTTLRSFRVQYQTALGFVDSGYYSFLRYSGWDHQVALQAARGFARRFKDLFAVIDRTEFREWANKSKGPGVFDDLLQSIGGSLEGMLSLVYPADGSQPSLEYLTSLGTNLSDLLKFSLEWKEHELRVFDLAQHVDPLGACAKSIHKLRLRS